MSDKPNCYFCEHRSALVWDCHSSCANADAHVVGKEHGIKHGWFAWPFNFDPVWLVSCDGYSPLSTRAEVETMEMK